MVQRTERWLRIVISKVLIGSNLCTVCQRRIFYGTTANKFHGCFFWAGSCAEYIFVCIQNRRFKPFFSWNMKNV